jgi:hypothetical protein
MRRGGLVCLGLQAQCLGARRPLVPAVGAHKHTKESIHTLLPQLSGHLRHVSMS